jgi:hypothetical protein
VRGRHVYVDFALGYLDEVERSPNIFPVSWTDVFPAGSDTPRSPRDVRARYFARQDRHAFRAELERLTDPNLASVERLAMRFGLRKQAMMLKHMRLASIWDTLRRLGLAIEHPDRPSEIDVDALNTI